VSARRVRFETPGPAGAGATLRERHVEGTDRRPPSGGWTGEAGCNFKGVQLVPHAGLLALEGRSAAISWTAGGASADMVDDGSGARHQRRARKTVVGHRGSGTEPSWGQIKSTRRTRIFFGTCD